MKPELIVTLKLPNEVKQSLRYIFDAYNAAFSSAKVSMNSEHNFNFDSYPITCMLWNVQGVGSREFLITLHEVIKVNKPMVFALVEMHMGGDRALQIADVLNYSGHIRVEAQGFSGGILVYWKPELVTMDSIEQSNQYITMEITRVGETPWFFSAIYASPDPAKRQDLLRDLKDFAARNNKPWPLVGNFNETRYGWERSSSCSNTSRRSTQFNHWVEDNQLIKLEFSGPSHTWALGNSKETHTSARLDCGLCNS
ncbi:uncharacterized protein LOC110719162 [Chenopodium quinoa]|uniref:uncharacterized protein LOC110719162 n=1 Tax=Chenopodium quinoa TaxID=63459 RepID=UPI000B78D30F|nr:uncharacterized protein LOC110719162 [Chenopodium quinoa]